VNQLDAVAADLRWRAVCAAADKSVSMANTPRREAALDRGGSIPDRGGSIHYGEVVADRCADSALGDVGEGAEDRPDRAHAAVSHTTIPYVVAVSGVLIASAMVDESDFGSQEAWPTPEMTDPSDAYRIVLGEAGLLKPTFSRPRGACSRRMKRTA